MFPIVFLPTFTIFLFFSLSCSPCLPSTNLEFQFPRSLSYLFSAHTLFTFVSTFSFPIPFHFYRLQISLSLSLTAHFSTSRTCSLNDSPAWLLTDSEQTWDREGKRCVFLCKFSTRPNCPIFISVQYSLGVSIGWVML